MEKTPITPSPQRGPEADGDLQGGVGCRFPVYIHLEGDAHIDAEERTREWSDTTTWTVMDYRSAKSMQARMADGSATPLDWMLAAFAGLLLIAFIGLVWSYVKGLRGHPRELWLMYFTKLTEYTAYGAAAVIFIPYLQQDVVLDGAPLGDTPGYLYYMVWGLVSTIITMMVGAVVTPSA